jgi:hypothetical protein
MQGRPEAQHSQTAVEAALDLKLKPDIELKAAVANLLDASRWARQSRKLIVAEVEFRLPSLEFG